MRSTMLGFFAGIGMIVSAFIFIIVADNIIDALVESATCEKQND